VAPYQLSLLQNKTSAIGSNAKQYMPLQTKQNVQVLNSNSKVSEDNVQVLLLYEALNKNAAMC